LSTGYPRAHLRERGERRGSEVPGGKGWEAAHPRHLESRGRGRRPWGVSPDGVRAGEETVATSRDAPTRGAGLGIWIPGHPQGSGAGRALTCVLVVEGVHAREVDGERLERGGQAEAALRALHARAGAEAAAAAAGGLGSLAAPFLTRSTARGVVAAARGRTGAPGLRGGAGGRGGSGAGGAWSPRRAVLPAVEVAAVAAAAEVAAVVAAQRALARGAPRRPRGAGWSCAPQPIGAARGRGCRRRGVGAGRMRAAPPPAAPQPRQVRVPGARRSGTLFAPRSCGPSLPKPSPAPRSWFSDSPQNQAPSHPPRQASPIDRLAPKGHTQRPGPASRPSTPTKTLHALHRDLCFLQSDADTWTDTLIHTWTDESTDTDRPVETHTGRYANGHPHTGTQRPADSLGETGRIPLAQLFLTHTYTHGRDPQAPQKFRQAHTLSCTHASAQTF
jgi:hypothetical protein